MSKYKLWHNDKVFVFEGEGVKVQDANVHALMQKIKRLKIGVEQCTESKKSIGKTNTNRRRQS
jgi:phage-related minor tail protein